jgi:hypothetical protein
MTKPPLKYPLRGFLDLSIVHLTPSPREWLGMQPVLKLLLGNISAIPATSRVVFESTPRDRLVTVSETETAAEAHDSTGGAAARGTPGSSERPPLNRSSIDRASAPWP